MVTKAFTQHLSVLFAVHYLLKPVRCHLYRKYESFSWIYVNRSVVAKQNIKLKKGIKFDRSQSGLGMNGRIPHTGNYELK